MRYKCIVSPARRRPGSPRPSPAPAGVRGPLPRGAPGPRPRTETHPAPPRVDGRATGGGGGAPGSESTRAREEEGREGAPKPPPRVASVQGDDGPG